MVKYLKNFDMKVKKIKIDSDGEQLKVKLTFIGLIVASYEYMLFETNSNNILENHKGNNQNPDDDNYLLPLPNNLNVGRILDIKTNFVALDNLKFEKYKITAELFQGNTKLGEVSDDGITSVDSQSSQLFIIIE
ncbi:MAG: hypothetical protein A2041_13070 [Bacteroidetes bacterium GWA2_31_9b]|nr:MAG: hypothetical protein A2041_13070 [Bacteroidetes bacterium GWA2_31_9b]